MAQSIVTKYLGPTNTKGSRIKATAAGGCTKTVHYDYALNQEANHRMAAVQLATDLDWKGQWFGGALDDSSLVWVLGYSSEGGFVVGAAS